jgi:hypothetical protein
LQELQQVIQTLNAGGVTIDVPVQLIEAGGSGFSTSKEAPRQT